MRGALGRLIAGTKLDAPARVSAEDRDRPRALGYVGARADLTAVPGGTLPEPKDTHAMLETYREAVAFAGDRKWGQAIALLQRILREDPAIVDGWEQLAAFAIRAERYDQAIDAYNHVIELDPTDSAGYLGRGNAQVQKAGRCGRAGFAVGVAGKRDVQRVSRARLSRELRSRHDAEEARREAGLARERPSCRCRLHRASSSTKEMPTRSHCSSRRLWN